MYCLNCGAQIADNVKFCPKCGSRVSAAPEPDTEDFPYEPEEGEDEEEEEPRKSKKKDKRKKKKRKGKKKWIAIVILVLLVVLLAGGTAVYFTSPAQKVQGQLNREEYTDARDTYNESVADNILWRALTNPKVTDRIEQLQTDYEEGARTYEEVIEILGILEQFDSDEIEEAAEAAIEKIMSLQESADLFAEAEELYEEGEYVDAMELYAEISEDSADYEAAQSRIDECKDKYIEEVLELTASPSTQSDYETAITLIEVALGAFPDDEDLLARQTELTDGYYALVKSEAMSTANEAISSGDYETAIEAIDDALDILGSDADLSSLRSSTQSSYESEVQSQVAELVAANDYESALELLEEALEVIPESTVLSDLYDTTEENQPVKLSDLKLSESGGAFELVTGQVVTTDTLGNTYGSGNLYKFTSSWLSYDDGYVKYYLGGEYTSLVFTLAVSDEEEDYKEERVLTIYGDDDALLYTSGDLSRTSVPVEVTVDVTGTDWIYIKADAVTYGVIILVYNPVLYK